MKIIGQHFHCLVGFFIHFVLFSTLDAQAQEHISNQRFGTVRLSGPRDNPVATALLLATFDAKIAQSLTRKQVLAMWITPKHYLSAIKKDGGCSYLAGELERLSQSIQSLSSKEYKKPVLFGSGIGAPLALVAYAQHAAAFSALGIDHAQAASFIPCQGDALKTDQKTNVGKVSIGDIGTWWNGGKRQLEWMKSIANRVDERNAPVVFIRLLKVAEELHSEPSSTTQLPLIELPGKASFGEYMGVFLSGDGGWATIDRDVGRYLSETGGMPIVGFDSLRYFWSRRTPEETTKAIADVLLTYSAKWNKHRFILIGFSLGADLVPFIANRLPPSLKRKVAGIVLMGPATKTDFEVHITDWLGVGTHYTGYDGIAEAKQLTVPHSLCIRGADDSGEDDSLCPFIKGDGAMIKLLPGGHHFSGDYENLAQIILHSIAQAKW